MGWLRRANCGLASIVPRFFPSVSDSMRLIPCLLLSPVLLIASSAEAAEPAWMQWRGPTRDGQVESLPDSLAGLTKQWSAALPPSYSGPLADADRVYTTATENKTDEVVVAYDRATGDEVWRASWPGAMSVPFFAASNGSWIRATPALAGGKLYVAGMLDVLVCLDAATGDEVWRRNFPQERSTQPPSFGYVASPLVHEGRVFVQAGSAVLALDAETGQTVWEAMKTGSGMMDGAFSSPILAADAPGGPQLLVQSRSTLAGLEPSSGEVLWSTPVEAFRGMNILTPTPRTVDTPSGPELQVFTSSYGGGSTLFAIPGGRGAVTTKWTNKSEAYMASPVSVAGRLIVPLRNQRVAALDWETGQTVWTSTPYGKYWSMLTDGQTVLALDQRGDLLRIDPAADSFTVIEERRISPSETWAHVAWDGELLLIRRLDGLDVYAAK